MPHGLNCWNNATAMPLDSLSVKLMAPYTNAPLFVLWPIRSVVIDNDVMSMVELPHPRSIDAIIAFTL